MVISTILCRPDASIGNSLMFFMHDCNVSPIKFTAQYSCIASQFLLWNIYNSNRVDNDFETCFEICCNHKQTSSKARTIRSNTITMSKYSYFSSSICHACVTCSYIQVYILHAVYDSDWYKVY